MALPSSLPSVELGNSWADVLRWKRNQMPKQYDTESPVATEVITQTTPRGNKVVHKGLLDASGKPYGYVTPSPEFGAIDYGTWHEKYAELGDRARGLLGVPLIPQVENTPAPQTAPQGLLGEMVSNMGEVSTNPYYTDPYAFNPLAPAMSPVMGIPVTEDTYPNLYSPPDYWNEYMADPYGSGQLFDPYTGMANDPYGNQFYSGYDPYKPSLTQGYNDYNSYGPISSEVGMSTDIYGNTYYAPSDLGSTT